jgi:hypothetical protein
MGLWITVGQQKASINCATAPNTITPRTNWQHGAAMPRFLLLTGVIILPIAGGSGCTMSTNVDAARAQPAASWCVTQHDRRDQPACYENMMSCTMAALTHASSCTRQPSPGRPSQVAANQHALRVVQSPVHRADASPRHHKLTADERDELFRKFQQWQSTHE